MIGTFLLSNNLGNTTCHVGPWIITRDTVLFILQKLNSTILTSWLTSILFFHHTYLDLTVSIVVFVFFEINTPSMETPRSCHKNWTCRAAHVTINPPPLLSPFPSSFFFLNYCNKSAPPQPKKSQNTWRVSWKPIFFTWPWRFHGVCMVKKQRLHLTQSGRGTRDERRE